VTEELVRDDRLVYLIKHSAVEHLIGVLIRFQPALAGRLTVAVSAPLYTTDDSATGLARAPALPWLKRFCAALRSEL
jgi:hypothetical protein